MSSKFSFLILTLFSFFTLNAHQGPDPTLSETFYSYSIVDIDSDALVTQTRNNNFNTIIIPNGEGGKWIVEVHNSNVVSENYLSRYADDNGIHNGNHKIAIPTKGIIKGKSQSRVSLTFNDGFVYGFIKNEGEYTFIEPLSYYEDSVEDNKFVIYTDKDLKPTAPATCGARDKHQKGIELQNIAAGKKGSDTRSVGDCYVVDYAIANDFLMFQEFGSVAGAENHAIGVTNDVQTNYDDEFGDELQLSIVEQFTPTTAAADPWTTSTNAGTLLDDFTDWGPGGFFATHDIGSIWTDRDFNGSTIGIAWLSVVCTSLRYNALQNWSSNGNLKRVMVAHEIGHNFSAGHDASGSGFIMAPSVNNTNSWSAASITSIDNHVASRWCLSDCASSNVPPNASFSYDVLEDCTPGLVHFMSNSTGLDLIYSWEFEGGSPATSTQENPFVTYDNPGIFNAKLTVTNAGGTDIEEQFNIIEITESPLANFFYEMTGTVTSFYNLSSGGSSYFWEFGDGETSTQVDPVHDYLEDGIYIVNLTVFSECGDVTMEQIIVVANPPTAAFDADGQEGCAPFTVQYTSNSSNNTDDFLWDFEGGNPSTSTAENPEVTYEEAGVFNVTLTVTNETGEDVLEMEDFITITDVPLADFNYVVDGSDVTFENLTEDANSYVWDFDDGNTNTDENPTHTYDNDGTYTVSLTAINDCGSTTATSEITISLVPVASFQVDGDNTGCVSFTANFESTSTNNPESFLWTFTGGTPETSTDANPSVEYDEAGSYGVTLEVSNSNGSNSITESDVIIVNDIPGSSFTAAEDDLMVTFTNTSSNADSYMWDFGDGNSSNDTDPIHTYNVEGVYTVILTSTNECGTHTMELEINNYTPVSANFSASATDGCADLSVDFLDFSSDNVTDWLWEFEGATPPTSTEQYPTVTYNSSGSFDVTLTVSHPESTETLTFPDYIVVSDVPVSSFDYFDDLFEVDFTNTSENGDSFAWDFGDGGVSDDENPTHTYSEEGAFEVTLTVTNECGSTEITQTVQINNLPTAAFSIANPIGCAPLTVDFMNTSSSNVESLSWTFAGGSPSASTEENPSITYTEPGTYSVILEVTSPAGTDLILMEDVVTVLDVPEAEVDYSVDGNILNASNIGSGAEDISWEIEGTIVEQDQLQYLIPANGIYIVTLNVSNDCGTDIEIFTIEVSIYPEVSIDNLPFTFCVGEEGIISDNSINAQGWTWTLDGANPGTSNEEMPTVVYDAEGSYDITLLVSNSYGMDEITYEDAVIVKSAPVAGFESNFAGNEVSFTSTSQGAMTYLWDFGDGNTSTEENPKHIYPINGEYTVTLTVVNECGETTFTETFKIEVNSIEDEILSGLTIYPNPARDFLILEFDQLVVDGEYSILGVNGQKIGSGKITNSIQNLNVTHLSNGTYFLRIKSKDAIAHKKFVLFK